MGLLVCFVCGHQTRIKPIKKGKTYRCSNCGRTDVIAIRRKQKLWEDWCDKDGITVEIAPYQVYAELKCYAENKRYKAGWPYVKFRQIFGRRPNGEAKVESSTPSPGLLLWIRQQTQSFVKRKREEERAAIGTQTKPEVRLVDMGDRLPVRGGHHDGTASALMTEEDWSVKW